MNRFPFWLSLFAGAASATGFAPLNFWPITLLALAFWMTIFFRSQNRRAAFFSGWLFGVGQSVIGLNWLAKAFTFQSAMPEWLGYVAVVLLALFFAIYPALAALAAWWLGKGRSVVFILALAGFWIVTEWLRSWVLTGSGWNPLGVILLPLGQLPFATKAIGSYGFSAVAIIAASSLWLLAQRQWKLALPVILVLAIPALVTKESVFYTPPLTSPGPKITVVQPNIGQQDKWQAGFEEKNLAKLGALTRRGDNIPRIIFWPEVAIPDYLETGYPERYYYGRPPGFVRQQLAGLIKPGDVLVLGALKLEFDEAGDHVVGARNSVFAMDANRRLLGSYDKSHLLPFGEYLPARPLLTAIGLSRFAPGDFDFWPGEGVGSFEIGDFGNMGLALCYEIIFSGQVVDRDNRPDFIFNPSNDAWFGSWGPPQHLAQARLRAIEEGLPVIRSTPTGISAVIDANGVVKDSVPLGQAGRIDTVLPPPKAPTLFARYGNILPLGFALFLLICAIAIRRRSR